MIEVITSVNEYYWNLIGRDSVNSWLRYWDDSFRLTVYTEDFELPIQTPRITTVDFSQLDSDYAQFQNEDFNPSTKRFAKKSYSVMHAMRHSTSSWIIWLDADVITQQNIGWIEWRELLRNDCLATYMGVIYTQDKQGNSGNWLVPETGVFAVNREHSEFDNFRDEYERRYHERDYTDLRRFYDNDVFGAAIRSVPSAQIYDLCATFSKPYKTPLRHTVLGPYLTHYKAKHSKAEYLLPSVDSNTTHDEGAGDPLKDCAPDPCDDL
jgi:hypothetical protein